MAVVWNLPFDVRRNQSFGGHGPGMSMLSNKKKDSTNLYQGIAGKYVKRDTPPILRSKFMG